VGSFDETVPHLACTSCGSTYPYDPWLLECPRCGGLLEVRVPQPDTSQWPKRPLGVWRYREALPVPRGVEPVTMGEGGTPLIHASSLSRAGARVWVKFEGANPTGSFKDRGMTVAVTVARAAGARVVVAASTGNTAASMAAYAARAGLRRVVVLPRGGVARGKLAQAVLHGAEIVEVEGSFDEALRIVRRAAGRGGVYPLNSYNPVRLEGQKTIAYEIVDQLGGPPDTVIVPVGNAGNISAIWKGFRELLDWGLIDEAPRMIGVQAEGAAPLVKAWRTGEAPIVEEPRTVASAIRIGEPVNWSKALRAVEESHGTLLAVADDEILEALLDLARTAGIGVEPSSAAPLAALRRLEAQGIIGEGERVVLVATGHALKDPDTIQAIAKPRVYRAASPESLEQILEG